MKRIIKSASEFGKVAVLMGGTSAEREISLISGQAVLKGLIALGIDAHAVDTKTELSKLTSEGFDRAFNILHGRNGEDGVMQGFLELHGIPYTGSGVMASALAMDKLRTKQVWSSCGIPTPPYCSVTRNSELASVAQTIGFPMMIKPIHEGSSIGMSKVNSEGELKSAVEKAFEYDNELLAEKWVTGKEYTVAILNDKALPPIRLETPNSFYDYDAKYQSDSTQYHCPAGLASEKTDEIKELALKAFNAVEASGWGRVDVMADEEGNFYPIEINTLPGMTGHSLVPMAAKAEGISFNDLVWLILETSVEQGGANDK